MQLFNKAEKSSKLIAEHEDKQRVLYETVGQLTIERDYRKKVLEQTPWQQRQQLIDSNAELSLRRQSELLQVNRSTIYYKAAEIDVEDIDLLNEIREIW